MADQSLLAQFISAGGLVGFGSLLSLILFAFAEKEAIRTGKAFEAIALIHFVFLLFFVGGLFQLYRSIARPISDLLAAMVAYQKGDFSIRVPIRNQGSIGLINSRFNEMAEKIEHMVQDLRKLDELKSEFISTVSHELRTPLTSITGYTRLVLSEDAGPLTDIQKEFLTVVDLNVVRLSGLISELLDMESLEAGKLKLKLIPQDMVSILEECMNTFKIVAQQKGLEFRYSVPKDLKKVMGDRSRLIQIFMNLISNAIKYTSTGHIEVIAEQTELAMFVRVRDSGVGMSPEEQEMLFQKFYRTRSSLESQEKGTGLGLVIVHKLVEAFGGNVSVESQTGSGTQFTVTFPVMATVETLNPNQMEPNQIEVDRDEPKEIEPKEIRL